MNPIIGETLKVLPGFEGVVPHFYLDSKGLVTCGMGHYVPDAAAALAIPFLVASSSDTGEVAPIWITTEYERVRDCGQPGHSPDFYRSQLRLQLRLSEGWAERDAAERLESEFLPALPGIFPAFKRYPLEAQVALLDMIYNLGTHGLRKWHGLIQACEGFNFARAAEESHRVGIQDSRNAWARAQFLAAEKSKGGVA